MSKELKTLLKKAQSNDSNDRYYAVVEIADLAEREAIQPLLAMIDDPNDDVKLVVASTLGFHGERHEDNSPVNGLVHMLRNAGNNVDLKYRIIESLGMIGDPEVGRLLTESLPQEEKTPEILKELIDAIGKVKYKPATKQVLKYLGHDVEGVRLATAKALGEIGDSSCTEPLFKAADDVSSEVAGNAIIAIGKIGDKSAVERLFAMLDQEPKLPTILENAVRDALDLIK